jgi:hypothetical protein
MQHALKVDPAFGITRPQRDRDHRQAIAQRDGPEIGGRSATDPTDQDRVIPGRSIIRRHRGPTSKQINLDQMGGAPEDLSTLGKVLLAIVAGTFVERAQEFDHRDEFPPFPVADFQE